MSKRTYRSVRAQALHYLARPHDCVPSKPIVSPAAWRSCELTETDWTYELSADDVAEIEDAMGAVRTVPMGELRASHIDLPRLGQRVREWRWRITNGQGFVRVRGVPVERWSLPEVERFFWALGQLLGRPGAQNGQGDLLGHVRDQRLGRDGQVRQYMTREEIHYHCDAADAVGLLCVHRAEQGGLSRIASSVTIFNRILELRPDLVPLLFAPMYYDARGDGGTDAFVARPAAHSRGRLRTFYHSEYMRTASQHPGIPPLSASQEELLDLYDQLANSPGVYLEMDLLPGDIQLISNHSIVHARTAYVDDDDPELRRHLLRLWLTLASSGSLAESVGRARSLMGLLTGLVRRTLYLRRHSGRG